MDERGKSSAKSADLQPMSSSDSAPNSSYDEPEREAERPPDVPFVATGFDEEFGQLREGLNIANPSVEDWCSSIPDSPNCIAYVFGRLVNAVLWMLNRSWLEGGVLDENPSRRRRLKDRQVADPYDEFSLLVARVHALASKFDPAFQNEILAEFNRAIEKWESRRKEACEPLGLAEQLFESEEAQETFSHDSDFPFEKLIGYFLAVRGGTLQWAFQLGLQVDRLLRPRGVQGLTNYAWSAIVPPAEWAPNSLSWGHLLGLAKCSGVADEVLGDLDECILESADRGSDAVRTVDCRIRESFDPANPVVKSNELKGPLGLWFDKTTFVLRREGREKTVNLKRSANRQKMVELLFKATDEKDWASRFRDKASLKGIAKTSQRSAISTFNVNLNRELGVKISTDRRFTEV